MAHDVENPAAHEPALSQRHARGPARGGPSPAERQLAPEADAPMQSSTAVSDQGQYVGTAGGYPGSDQPQDPLQAPGGGTYGYVTGPGVGVPGGEHQPEGIPDPYSPGLEDQLPDEPDRVAEARKDGDLPPR